MWMHRFLVHLILLYCVYWPIKGHCQCSVISPGNKAAIWKAYISQDRCFLDNKCRSVSLKKKLIPRKILSCHAQSTWVCSLMKMSKCSLGQNSDLMLQWRALKVSPLYSFVSICLSYTHTHSFVFLIIITLSPILLFLLIRVPRHLCK